MGGWLPPYQYSCSWVGSLEIRQVLQVSDQVDSNLIFLSHVAAWSTLNEPENSATAVMLTTMFSLFIQSYSFSNKSSPNGYASDPAHSRRLLETKQCPGCNLNGANLKEVNLQGANLQGAELSGARISGANLRGESV